MDVAILLLYGVGAEDGLVFSFATCAVRPVVLTDFRATSYTSDKS